MKKPITKGVWEPNPVPDQVGFELFKGQFLHGGPDKESEIPRSGWQGRGEFDPPVKADKKVAKG